MLFDILKVQLKDDVLYYVRNEGENPDEILTDWRYYGARSGGTTTKELLNFFKGSIVKSGWKHRHTFKDVLNINYKDIPNLYNLY